MQVVEISHPARHFRNFPLLQDPGKYAKGTDPNLDKILD